MTGKGKLHGQAPTQVRYKCLGMFLNYPLFGVVVVSGWRVALYDGGEAGEASKG